MAHMKAYLDYAITINESNRNITFALSSEIRFSASFQNNVSLIVLH